MRRRSHFQKREPFLEYLLAGLRYGRVIDKIPAASKVLDLGCGFDGGLLKKISYKIRDGVGLDLSVKEDIGERNVKLISHDLNKKLPLADQSFDAVTSLAVVEHLNNCEGHFSECFRTLKRGGVLLLTTPAPKSKNLLELLASVNLVSKEEINDHKRYLSIKELESLARQAGFSSARGEGFQFGFNNFLVAIK
ncbi:MAG: hypothetical protein QG620_603 [Patescibacteria group bacterium]|nr:hypothetical protein [Patescibacteria group bacterium]